MEMIEEKLNTIFTDCLALSELPYFVLDELQNLKISPDFPLKIIDFHTHIGMTYFLKGKIDLWKKTNYVHHYLPTKNNPIDLQNYSFNNLTKESKKKMIRDFFIGIFKTPEISVTHTIPNILMEMDNMCVEKSVVLALEIHFLFNNNDVIFTNLKNNERFIPFCSIHPALGKFEEKIEKHIAAGAKGLKFHPVFQMIAPDNDKSLKLFSYCNKYKLPILSHTSASGSEPKFMQNYSRMERFREAIKTAKDVPFILGHSGMKDGYEDAINYALEFENVYLELSGQSINSLKKIFEKVDHSRLLFGSDWPFYHVALPLAKVLIATEGDENLRRKVLYDNAVRILGLTTL